MIQVDIRQATLVDDRVTALLAQQLTALHRIRKHLADISASETDTGNDDGLINETDNDDKVHWHRLARVLDKFFLGFYLFCFVVVTLVFIVQLRNQPSSHVVP